jgi:cytosine/uracil/thiamine/allantoin permease
MSKRFLDWFTVAGTVLILAVFGVVILTVTAAHGQPASQPIVVAPVAAAGAWAWFVANAGWLVPLAVSFLSSLATGLSDYPKAAGAAKVIRVAVACLGVVQFRNAPGSLKAPLAPPAKA